MNKDSIGLRGTKQYVPCRGVFRLECRSFLRSNGLLRWTTFSFNFDLTFRLESDTGIRVIGIHQTGYLSLAAKNVDLLSLKTG